MEIANDFLHSPVAACTPDVQLTRIGQDNIFANFLAVHPSLRKNLVTHYLAALNYYDNMVMPQWRMPQFIAHL